MFSPEENYSKTYKVTMQFFPVSDSDDVSGYISIGPKATEIDVNTRWGTTVKLSIGGSTSNADIKVNQWNEISYTFVSGYYQNNSNDLFLDGIGFTYNTTNNELYLPYYVDNIVITPINYFGDVETNEVVETTADAGYYADTFDADEKEGVISIDSYISIEKSAIQTYDSVGLYIYRLDDPSKEATVSKAIKDADHNRQPIKDAGGFINVLIEEIAEEYFDTYIVVKPYVVMFGQTYYGDTFTYCVNDAGDNLKWLGAKTVAEVGGEE